MIKTKLMATTMLSLSLIVLLVQTSDEVVSQAAFAENVGSQDVIGRPGYQPDKVCGDRLCSDSASSNKVTSKQESSTSISSEYDALSAQFAEKTQEMAVAAAYGDSDKVEELQNELKNLRDQINKWKNS